MSRLISSCFLGSGRNQTTGAGPGTKRGKICPTGQRVLCKVCEGTGHPLRLLVSPQRHVAGAELGSSQYRSKKRRNQWHAKVRSEASKQSEQQH